MAVTAAASVVGGCGWYHDRAPLDRVRTRSDAGYDATTASRACDPRGVKGAGVGQAEQMTESGGHRIGDVRLPRGASGQQPRYHGPDLFLFRATVAGHRFLDRRGTIFDDGQSGDSEGREDDPARVGKLERRTRADAVKRRLDGGFRWDVLGDNREDGRVKARQSFRQR
jgi:hypothetical protein